MADISIIKLPNGSEFNIKDATAREAISGITSFDFIVCTSAANTPKDVVWNNGGTSVTGTLVASASTKGKVYLVPSTNGTKDIYDEYITVNTTGSTYIWELFGNTDVHMGDLGALAFKDSASGTGTVTGTVSKPSFTGTEGSLSVKGTPAGTVTISKGTGTANYTPAGTVSQPTFSGTAGSISAKGTPSGSVTVTTDKTAASKNYTPEGSISVTPNVQLNTASVTPMSGVGTLPELTMSVTDETLNISFSQGTLPTQGTAVTVATGIKSQSASGSFTGTATAISASFSGSELTATGTFTPSGTVSQPTFSGEGAELKGTFSGSELTSTGKFTPSGNVSQPTFGNGSATVTVS